MSSVEEVPPVTNGDASVTQSDDKAAEKKPKSGEETLTNGTEPVQPPGDAEDKDTKKGDGKEGEDDEEDDKTPAGSICQIMNLVRRTKENGEEETCERAKPKSTSKYAKYAVVSQQFFDNKGKLERTTIEINSPLLLRALRDTVKFYPAEPLTFDDQAKFEGPFMLLNHYLDELEEYAESSDDDDLKSHMKLMREVLESEAGDEVIESRKHLESGLISYKSMWRLFRPGELFYNEEYGYARLYVLQKVGYGKHPRNGAFFEASVTYTAHDGTRAGQVAEKIRMFEIDHFVGGGASKITSLKLFPLSYIPGKDTLLEHLATRGKRYLEIGSHGLFEYEGLYQYLKPPPEDYYSECDSMAGRWLPLTGSGRVFVDAKTFAEEKKDSEQSVWSRIYGDQDDDKDDSQGFESLEVDPKLCPPFAFGYNFDTKHWCKFYVEHLSEVKWASDAMDQLIISPQQKRLITSLVTAHEFPSRSRNEAQLKGKGLIILLHGTPGSGKTLTAELSAEATHRPLIKISTGELGSYGSRITAELRKMLGYASTWRAIVLIDEADVFLESRTTGGGSAGASSDKLEHNNLVAVFLRQLEYFQGILFLTSNRVGVFDPAIRSRLHLAIQYLSPDRERREVLWQHGLAAARFGDAPGADLVSTAKALSAAEMNGREIANSINTAKTLAKGEAKPLARDHIETVVGVWEEFQEAVKLGGEWSA